jgi:hypothetical protein
VSTPAPHHPRQVRIISIPGVHMHRRQVRIRVFLACMRTGRQGPRTSTFYPKCMLYMKIQEQDVKFGRFSDNFCIQFG